MRIIEIAKKANVSPATVSRAINEPSIVAPESLARIRQVMEQHGYSPLPPSHRRGPKTRQPKLRKIGAWFVGGEASNPSLNWFQDQLMQEQAENSRYRVDLNVIFSSTADELPRAISERKLDGVIIQGMEPSPACLAKLQNIPYVWFMTRRSQTYAGDYVEPNNEENGQIAADYLHAKGHKSVAVITTDSNYNALARRAAAFQTRARELGLEVHAVFGKSISNPNYLSQMPPQEESDLLVKHITQLPRRPTGLYLPSDHFCGAVLRAFRLAGLMPKRDFEAILGNYNPLFYHNLEHFPPVIDINRSTLVRKVVDHLAWRIENPNTTGRIGISVSPTLRTPESLSASTS
ncbi:MAG: LacI family DNA-binding transcriptional regulator [Nibricoccus sp.]